MSCIRGRLQESFPQRTSFPTKRSTAQLCAFRTFQLRSIQKRLFRAGAAPAARRHALPRGKATPLRHLCSPAKSVPSPGPRGRAHCWDEWRLTFERCCFLGEELNQGRRGGWGGWVGDGGRVGGRKSSGACKQASNYR